MNSVQVLPRGARRSLRVGRALLVMSALWSVAGEAAAEWRASFDELGTLVTSSASVSHGGGFASVFCEGVPAGRAPAETDAIATEPGMVMFALDARLFKADPLLPGPVTATLTVDGRTWTESFTHFQMFDTMGWQVPVDSPFIAALRNGSGLRVRTPVTETSIPLDGSGKAIAAALARCAELFPASPEVAALAPLPELGDVLAPLPPLGDASTPLGDPLAPLPPLEEAAPWWSAKTLTASFTARGCEAAAGLVRDVSIDGDGAPDFLVDMSKLTCPESGAGDGTCAALGCGLEVWISSLGPDQPALSTQGFDLRPVDLGAGRSDIYVIGNGVPCAAPPSDFACANRFAWNGRSLLRAGDPIRMDQIP